MARVLRIKNAVILQGHRPFNMSDIHAKTRKAIKARRFAMIAALLYPSFQVVPCPIAVLAYTLSSKLSKNAS